jgi:hypothetical protein
MNRMTGVRIWVWVCVLYFGAVAWGFGGLAVWGSLGVIRPGDVEDGMMEASHAMGLINTFAGNLQRLVLFVCIGWLMLAAGAIWLTTIRFAEGSRRRPAHPPSQGI